MPAGALSELREHLRATVSVMDTRPVLELSGAEIHASGVVFVAGAAEAGRVDGLEGAGGQPGTSRRAVTVVFGDGGQRKRIPLRDDADAEAAARIAEGSLRSMYLERGFTPAFRAVMASYYSTPGSVPTYDEALAAFPWVGSLALHAIANQATLLPAPVRFHLAVLAARRKEGWAEAGPQAMEANATPFNAFVLVPDARGVFYRSAAGQRTWWVPGPVPLPLRANAPTHTAALNALLKSASQSPPRASRFGGAVLRGALVVPLPQAIETRIDTALGLITEPQAA